MDIPVKTAMQNDVNGIAWCMPDYFKNTGVKYLIMGINETRSILPFDKPTCFLVGSSIRCKVAGIPCRSLYDR